VQQALSDGSESNNVNKLVPEQRPGDAATGTPMGDQIVLLSRDEIEDPREEDDGHMRSNGSPGNNVDGQIHATEAKPSDHVPPAMEDSIDFIASEPSTDQLEKIKLKSQKKLRDPAKSSNYASGERGAKIIYSTPGSNHVSSILVKDLDRYMIAECEGITTVIIQLSEAVHIDTIQLRSLEYYSAGVKEFQIFGIGPHEQIKAPLEHDTDEEWDFLQEFVAENTREAQIFYLDEPASVYFVKFRVLSWHPGQSVCTLSSFEVYGENENAKLIREIEEHDQKIQEKLDQQRNKKNATTENFAPPSNPESTGHTGEVSNLDGSGINPGKEATLDETRGSGGSSSTQANDGDKNDKPMTERWESAGSAAAGIGVFPSSSPSSPSPSSSPTSLSSSSSSSSTPPPNVTIEDSTRMGSEWILCARENQTCNFNGTKQVRFGTQEVWSEEVLTGPVHCSTDVFDLDEKRDSKEQQTLTDKQHSSSSSSTAEVDSLHKGPGSANEVLLTMRNDQTNVNFACYIKLAPGELKDHIKDTNKALIALKHPKDKAAAAEAAASDSPSENNEGVNKNSTNLIAAAGSASAAIAAFPSSDEPNGAKGVHDQHQQQDRSGESQPSGAGGSLGETSAEEGSGGGGKVKEKRSPREKHGKSARGTPMQILTKKVKRIEMEQTEVVLDVHEMRSDVEDMAKLVRLRDQKLKDLTQILDEHRIDSDTLLKLNATLEHYKIVTDQLRGELATLKFECLAIALGLGISVMLWMHLERHPTNPNEDLIDRKKPALVKNSRPETGVVPHNPSPYGVHGPVENALNCWGMVVQIVDCMLWMGFFVVLVLALVPSTDEVLKMCGAEAPPGLHEIATGGS